MCYLCNLKVSKLSVFSCLLVHYVHYLVRAGLYQVCWSFPHEPSEGKIRKSPPTGEPDMSQPVAHSLTVSLLHTNDDYRRISAGRFLKGTTSFLSLNQTRRYTACVPTAWPPGRPNYISVIWLRFYKNSIQLFVQSWSERRRRRKRRVQRTAALWRTSEDRRRRKQTQRPLPPQPRWTQLSVTLRFKKKTKKRHKPTSVSLPVVKRSPAQPSNNNQNRKREQSELQRDEAHSETSEETCEDASLLPQPAAYSLTRPESHQFV